MGLARRHRIATTSFVYAGVAAVALASAYVLQFGPSSLLQRGFGAALLTLVIVRVAVNYGMGMGMGQWRYVGSRDYVRLLLAETVGSVCFFLLTRGVGVLPSLPVSVVVLEWVLNGYITAALWIAYRLTFEHSQA